jgi:eukaryotic-like serine/threonine-protein kinase
MSERCPPQAAFPGRERIPIWFKDFGRTLDYLETRRDFDGDRVAYYGFSTAFSGVTHAALEPRLKVAILLSAGIPPYAVPPHVDPVNFAPRSRVPTLMINGRDDFLCPLEISQRPFFRLLGTPESDKRHVVLDGGHLPPDRRAIIKAVLDWLDRSLGPVVF